MITIKKALMLGMAMMVSAGAIAPLGASATVPRMTVGGWITAATGKVTIAGELACLTATAATPTRQDQNLTLSYTIPGGTKVTATLREITGITCSSGDATSNDGGAVGFQATGTCTRERGATWATEAPTILMDGRLFDGATGGGQPTGEKGFDFVDVQIYTSESDTPEGRTQCEGSFTGDLLGGTLTFHGEMPQQTP